MKAIRPYLGTCCTLFVYSYDMRSGLPTHWKNKNHFGKRGSFEEDRGELVLRRVNEDDQGEYKCRVDFKKAQTLSYSVNLTVISK